MFHSSKESKCCINLGCRTAKLVIFNIDQSILESPIILNHWRLIYGINLSFQELNFLKPRDQRYYSQTWVMFNHKLCRMERLEITLRIFPSWRWTSWCHKGKKYDLQAWINKPSWAPKIQWKMRFRYIVSTPMYLLHVSGSKNRDHEVTTCC